MRLDSRTSSGLEHSVSPGYRIILDGLEVTDQCFLADDEIGEIGIYLRDDSGNFYRDLATHLEAAQEIRHGRVVIIPLSHRQPSTAASDRKELIA